MIRIGTDFNSRTEDGLVILAIGHIEFRSSALKAGDRVVLFQVYEDDFDVEAVVEMRPEGPFPMIVARPDWDTLRYK